MDFGLAFTYVFKDPDWFKKVAIVGLISLIPIIGQLVVLGWALNVAKRVMTNEYNALPEVDFGADLGRGFMGFVIAFVYSLPITLVSGIFAIIDAVAANSMNNSEGVAVLITVFSLCFGLFAVLYGIAVALLIPAAYGNYLAKDSLGAAFKLGEVFGLVRNNIGAYLIVLLGTFVAGLIAPLGAIACVIGVLLTAAYAQAVMGHLYGQAYREATKTAVVLPAA